MVWKSRFLWNRCAVLYGPRWIAASKMLLPLKIRKGVTFYWGVQKSAFSIKTAICAEIRIEANTADRRAASPQSSHSLRQSPTPATPTRIRSQSILRTYLEAQSILHTWSSCSQFYNKWSIRSPEQVSIYNLSQHLRDKIAPFSSFALSQVCLFVFQGSFPMNMSFCCHPRFSLKIFLSWIELDHPFINNGHFPITWTDGSN